MAVLRFNLFQIQYKIILKSLIGVLTNTLKMLMPLSIKIINSTTYLVCLLLQTKQLKILLQATLSHKC